MRAGIHRDHGMKQFIDGNFGKKFSIAAWLAGWCFFILTTAEIHAESEKPVWGVAAMTLGAPCARPPTPGELLSGQIPATSLDTFYCAGGKNIPATPTQCRVAYDTNELFVVFACTENDLSFPVQRHPADWYALASLPSDQDTAFPDKVDLFLQPDRKSGTYYQFAVTLDGQTFGCGHRAASVSKKTAADDNEAGAPALGKITNFTATVTRQERQWLVYLRIPWKTIGGQPSNYFGLLPVRTRWRNGEVSSPAAFDFDERAPRDLFIETHLGGAVNVQTYATNLCRLPSGTWRWQPPARLSYPDEVTRRQIWQLQLSLATPTGAENFASRLYLTQCWVDLLALEGFNFRPAGGSIVDENMQLLTTRTKVNAALQKNEMSSARHLLDAYLKQLDQFSRDWFADGSPGDLLTAEWSPVSQVTNWEVKANVLFLHCLAGKEPIDLHLSLPKTGGVRIYGTDEGYFKPADLLPLNINGPTNPGLIKIADGRVSIRQKPFAIFYNDAAGKKVTQLGADDLRFRFGRDGKILAADVRNDLKSDEVLYGFGERYDHFSQNGRVLTLWGMDDWLGNTAGLMNETYKPIALFHSSRGYSVFDNSTYRLRADLGKTIPQQYRLTQSGSVFDYYFWIDSPEKALRSYTDLTGKPVLPPKWAFEPWMGRTGRGWRGAPGHNAVAEEERVTEKFAALDIPHSAIYSEGEGSDSPELNQFMAARGIKVLSWYWPVVGPSQQAQLLPETKPEELPLLNTGDEKFSRDLGYIDFTRTNALELIRRWWNRRLSLGVAGSMIDFGDRVPEAAVFANGRSGAEMHNFYAYDYHRTEAAVFREKRGDDFILFGRAAAPGSQKWVAQFGGDHPATFAGLQAVLTGALNLTACGFSIWGSDLGGFLGWPEPAVYMRWTQFACFSPLMRSHGRTPREPWNFGDAAVANYKYYAWVRENLLDYIYGAAVASHATGVPLMRSLAVAFPEESRLAAVPDEYLFGRDLLVAPVIDDAAARTIYFPAGTWTSLWNGTAISGPATLTTNVAPAEIPVFLRAGAVVPVQLNPALEFGGSLTVSRINALVLTPPAQVEEVTLLNHQGESAAVIMHPATNGWTLTLKNLAEKNCVLIYAAPVTGVKVAGRSLPALTGIQSDPRTGSSAAGWYYDSAERRTVVRLPADLAQPEKIEVTIQSRI
jgi:alpha-glucosidase (family GH31 glycosyl hydrolase)